VNVREVSWPQRWNALLYARRRGHGIRLLKIAPQPEK
jgi:hypothetical protein